MIKKNGLELFLCQNCGQTVDSVNLTGTRQRNHCPFCLYSKHVDKNKAGDREAHCHGSMKPVALSFKEEGTDKYGRKRQGELMLVHECSKCAKISINRIAGDDDPNTIERIFTDSQRTKYENNEFYILKKNDETELKRQLHGNLHLS